MSDYGTYTYSENAVHREAPDYASVDVTAYANGTIGLYAEDGGEAGVDVSLNPGEARALMFHLDQALGAVDSDDSR